MKKISIILFVCAVFITASYANNFYAFYTRVETGDPLAKKSPVGKYADVVVQLENGKVIFTRSSSYLPYWQVNNKKWLIEEIIPRSGDGSGKRPDKNNIYSYVRLIQQAKF
jgi:hypothetical protein